MDKVELTGTVQFNEEPHFINRMKQLNEVLNELHYELENLDHKLKPYSVLHQNKAQAEEYGSASEPEYMSDMDRAIDETYDSIEKALDTVMDIKDRFNG